MSLEDEIKNEGLTSQMVQRIAELEDFKRKHETVNHAVTPLSGWISFPGTWTFLTASTYTVPGDQTIFLTPGTKIKFDQTTTKYLVVFSSSYSAITGLTTVTIIVNTDYVLANAAITNPFFSYIEMPQGWPDWFNWASVSGGFSVVPTDTVYRFSTKGRTMKLNLRQVTAGTSNATTFTQTLPCDARTIANQAWIGPGLVINNSVQILVPCRLRILTGGSVLNVFSDFNNAPFAAANLKSLTNGFIDYEF